MDNNALFPAQKKTFKQKNADWRKANVKAAEDYINTRHLGYRQSLHNKITNYNLYSDILDQDDIERTCNPFNFKSARLTTPAKMQNYPIVNPKIDLLVGEASKRKIDYRVRVINEDAISGKEEKLKEEFYNVITQGINNEAESDEEFIKKIQRFEHYKNYEYQDIRERAGTQILKHLNYKLRLPYQFTRGFKDVLIAAEEIYYVDSIEQEVIFEKLNPKNVYTVRSGESNRIEDSDIIVIENYYSPGKVVDEYYNDLTPDEIDTLEQGSFGAASNMNKKGIDIGRKAPRPYLSSMSGSLDTALLENDLSFRQTFDAEGNIRVLKVFWKSRRKLLEVTSFDEDGDEVIELEDEHYIIDKDRGESSKVIWINEWWEGHKIGGGEDSDDSGIYTRMRPKPVQFRSPNNPSKCYPGIVGTIYNTNDNVAMSLMDRAKPYQYMYNILMYNAELAISKNYGKIMSLDLARVPANWKVEEWLSFAQTMGVALEDSFKEGNKGAAQGKLAGTMNRPTPVIDAEMGNTIQLYMNMMGHIKNEMGEIIGVSQSRQGQIHQRQAVGNTEREVVQSSHITEFIFMQHEETQVRVLQTLLEVAKHAWINLKSKKVQHVLDDGTTEIFDIDIDKFTEADYDIAIINGMDDQMKDTIKSLAHAGLQNQMLSFTQLLDILSTDSISGMKRKMEKAEQDKLRQAEENQKMQMEAQAQSEQSNREHEISMQNIKDSAALERELVKIESRLSELSIGEDDSKEDKKLALEIEKIRTALQIAQDRLSEDKRKNREKESIERDKLKLAEKNIKRNKE